MCGTCSLPDIGCVCCSGGTGLGGGGGSGTANGSIPRGLFEKAMHQTVFQASLLPTVFTPGNEVWGVSYLSAYVCPIVACW